MIKLPFDPVHGENNIVAHECDSGHHVAASNEERTTHGHLKSQGLVVIQLISYVAELLYKVLFDQHMRASVAAPSNHWRWNGDGENDNKYSK